MKCEYEGGISGNIGPDSRPSENLALLRNFSAY